MLCRNCGCPKSRHGTFLDVLLSFLGVNERDCLFYCKDCDCPGFNMRVLDRKYVEEVNARSNSGGA